MAVWLTAWRAIFSRRAACRARSGSSSPRCRPGLRDRHCLRRAIHGRAAMRADRSRSGSLARQTEARTYIMARDSALSRRRLPCTTERTDGMTGAPVDSASGPAQPPRGGGDDRLPRGQGGAHLRPVPDGTRHRGVARDLVAVQRGLAPASLRQDAWSGRSAVGPLRPRALPGDLGVHRGVLRAHLGELPADPLRLLHRHRGRGAARAADGLVDPVPPLHLPHPGDPAPHPRSSPGCRSPS